jgi:hypothetical protein
MRCERESSRSRTSAIWSGHAGTCSAYAGICGKLLTHTLVSSRGANFGILSNELNLHRESVQATSAIGWISSTMALPFSISATRN